MGNRLTVWLPTIRAGSGADVFAMRLARAIERAGHRPLLQWFAHRYELMPWRLANVAAPAGIDVVHAGSWQGFAFKRPGVPLVITEHQYVKHPAFLPFRGPVQRLYHRLFAERWMRKSYACADAIVAVSDFCAGVMRNDLRRDITVIHNWVDTNMFEPRNLFKGGAERPSRDDMCFRLLFVGNPSRWKGADLLPEIAKRLGDRYQILCMGGLRKRVSSSRLPSNMLVLPKCEPERMPAVYRSVDAVLVPARYEAFGYVALEAMACGLPVIGFNASGVAEVCRDGETALLAPVDDIEMLEQLTRQLAADPELRERLGQSGRFRAVQCFDEEQAIRKYLDIYRQVMKSGYYAED